MREEEHRISIDRVTELLTELADELPDAIYQNLNLGILVSEETRISHGSVQGYPLYTLGEYRKSRMGRQIVIYYGSFMRVYSYLDEMELKNKLRETLHHELLHHLESQGGEFGLEYEDFLRQQQYKNDVRKRNGE